MAVAESPLLAAQGLYVSLGGLPILRNVGLEVRRGEAVALVGGNGSGKTTLIRTVLGLVPHQQGEVSLFGASLEHFNQWYRVGYVPQHAALNVNHATVREIVNSGRLPHLKPFQPMRRTDKQAVEEALEMAGLTDRSSWPFHSLSGGQKQRSLIARALASGPQLLVMDEPFAGVDIHSQDSLAQLLGELRVSGLGMAIVLHEIGPLNPLLDRRITLCDGRIVDSEISAGSHTDPPPHEPSVVGLEDPVARRTT